MHFSRFHISNKRAKIHFSRFQTSKKGAQMHFLRFQISKKGAQMHFLRFHISNKELDALFKVSCFKFRRKGLESIFQRFQISKKQEKDPNSPWNSFAINAHICKVTFQRIMQIFPFNVSVEQHTCLDGSAKNCYYQCMLEKYNSEYGPVMPDCSCTKGAAVPPSMIAMRSPRIAVRSPIRTVRSSASCSNANYTSCNWYQDCLKARLPCQGLEVDYAIKEAKHFCQLYDNSYNTFSPNGQSWIDSVRTCLKSRLVYFTNPFWQYTCASIQQSSFASRKCCYTGGSSCSSFGAPSMCSLPIADWWKVFWTMANSFMTSATAAKESFRGNHTGGDPNRALRYFEVIYSRSKNARLSLEIIFII